MPSRRRTRSSTSTGRTRPGERLSQLRLKVRWKKDRRKNILLTECISTSTGYITRPGFEVKDASCLYTLTTFPSLRSFSTPSHLLPTAPRVALSHTHTLHTHTHTHTPDACSYAAATITHKLTPEGTLAYFGTMMVGDKAGPKQTIQLPAFGQVDYTDDVALENA